MEKQSDAVFVSKVPALQLQKNDKRPHVDDEYYCHSDNDAETATSTDGSMAAA